MSSKISVVIPAFNCADTVAESAFSAIDGNGDVVDEVLLVDDKSTDNTLRVLRNLERDHSTVRIICHSQNLGGASARNTAVDACKNDLVFCLDSDNILSPGSLSDLARLLEEKKGDVAAFRELHFFRGSSKKVTHLWRFPEGLFTFADYLAGSVVPGASGNYLFRKSAWRDVGGYRVGSGALDSWTFGLDLVAAGKAMLVAPGGHYLHRYGTASYWIRESKRRRIGLLASELMLRYLERLDEDSRNRVKSSAGKWFEQIDRKPLRVKGLEPGCAGVVLNKSLSMRLKFTIWRLVSALGGS